MPPGAVISKIKIIIYPFETIVNNRKISRKRDILAETA